MRPRSIATATLMVAISSAIQFDRSAAAQATDVDAQLTAELQRMEQVFWTASRDHDAEALDRLVAPEFTLRGAGMRQQALPRAVWMDNTINRLEDAWFELLYVAARKLADDLVVVSQLNESKGTIDGKEMNCLCYGVDFWKKRGGNWQILGRYAIGSGNRPGGGSQARPPTRGAGPGPQLTERDVDPQLTDTLRDLEQELANAALRGVIDQKAVDRLVASEFTIRSSDAPKESVPRPSWIQTLRGAKLVSVEQQYHAARRLADDVAVVSLVITQYAAGGHPDQNAASYVVDVWKRRASQWQLIARYSGNPFDAVSR
jgi:hypothetical protein